jgi:hypothetical protein
MPNYHYFAVDGNYGGADGLLQLETDNWTEEDWTEVEEAGDAERCAIAEQIDKKYTGERLV